MAGVEPRIEAGIDPDPPAWRERAVSRSVNAARDRAEQRVQRFLDAAFELIDEKGTTEFTIQEVIDQSKQSLRGFYQYFDGKNELMLAVFEDTVRSSAKQLLTQLDPEAGPLERLRCFVTGLAVLCHRSSPTSRVLVDFAQRMLTEHSEQAVDTYRPLIVVLQQLLADGAEAGIVRAGVGTDSTAAVMLQVITFDELTQAISGTIERGDAATESAVLWDLFTTGLGLSS